MQLVDFANQKDQLIEQLRNVTTSTSAAVQDPE